MESIAFKTNGGCFFVSCFYLIFYFKAFLFQIQNCDNIPNTAKKIQKSKHGIKKDIKDSIIICEKYKNKDIKEEACKADKCDDAAVLIQEFEGIIKTKKMNIVLIAYQQGKIFQKFNKRQKFANMLKDLGVSKSIIAFKVSLVKITDKYPKLKNLPLSLKLLKTMIKENNKR